MKSRSAPRESAAGGAERRADGANDEDEERQEGELGRRELADVREVHARSEQDEQSGDKENLEVLLELHDVPKVHPSLIGEEHAHDGHGEQPRLVLELVRDHIAEQRERERGGGMEVVGDPEARQAEHQDPRGQRAEHRARYDRGADPDGVDQDALPFEHRAAGPGRPDLAQQRQDDRRPGHGEHRAHQHRELPGESQYVVCGEGAQRPRHHRAQRDELGHDAEALAQLRQVQGQRTLKKDDGDRQGDERQQEVAEHLVRPHQAHPSGPAAIPKMSRSRIAGRRRRQPSHCAAPPRTATETRPMTIDSFKGGLVEG